MLKVRTNSHSNTRLPDSCMLSTRLQSLVSTSSGVAPFTPKCLKPTTQPTKVPVSGSVSMMQWTEVMKWDARRGHSKIGASLANTSSMIDSGTLSSLRPLREPMSMARG